MVYFDSDRGKGRGKPPPGRLAPPGDRCQREERTRGATVGKLLPALCLLALLAPAAASADIDDVLGRMSSSRGLSAHQALTSVDRFDESPEIVARIVDLSINYFVTSIMHRMFAREIGGARMRTLIIYESEGSGGSGKSIERPSRFPVKAGGLPRYVPLRRSYRRFPGKITHVFLLDSCENVFEKSKKAFVAFMNGVLIEP